jgi:phenylacetate-CoA ligase
VFPFLRSALRVGLGWRPRQRDLDLLIERLRKRALREGRLRRPPSLRLPQGFLLRRLRGLQRRKLRRTVAEARRFVPFYRERLAGLPEVRRLGDLARLPVTRRADLERDVDAFLSRRPGLNASVSMKTSGTTGRPLRLWLTPEEFDTYASIQAVSGLIGGFLGPASVLQVSVPLENSITARIVAEAGRRAGALTLLPGLAGTLDDHLDSILEERDVPGKERSVTNLLCAPAFLWALTARAEATGRDLSGSRLRTIFCFGAPADAALRERVLRVWGVRLQEGYSLTETPGTGAIECEEGRLHFLDVSGVLEVVDPESLAPVPPGEVGMALITTLVPDRELQPVLRYWTDDLVRLSPETSCACGTPSTIIEEIVGRSDDVVIFGAVNLHPRLVGDELSAHPELVQPPRYALDIERRDAEEHCLLDVEVVRPLGPDEEAALATRLRRGLTLMHTRHQELGAVRSELRFVPRGSIAEPYPYELVDSLHV